MVTSTSALSVAKLGTLKTRSRHHVKPVRIYTMNNASDLTNYFSQQDQIAELKRALYLQSKLTRKYKMLWRSAIGEHELPTDKARKLIAEAKDAPGSVTARCRIIARAVGLKPCTVRQLWYAKAYR